MIDMATTTAVLVLTLCIIMAAYRVIAGPSQPDRVIGLDTIGVNTVGLILVLGMKSASRAYVDTALVIASVGVSGDGSAGEIPGGRNGH